MRRTKPFIYFSDAVLTPTHSTRLIRDAASRFGAHAAVDIDSLFTETFLSVRSQAMLQRSEKQFYGERFAAWLSSCIDNLADGFIFDSQTSKYPFTKQLQRQLFQPDSYFVPPETRQFVKDLEYHGIGWGILANGSHLYLKALQKLEMMPKGPLLQAVGPSLFKPLPSMVMRAIDKAPQSCGDLWFIGDCANPCDNVTMNPLIKCALVNSKLVNSEPVSSRFRVPNLDSLRPILLPKPDIDLGFLIDLTQPSTDVLAESTAYTPLPVPHISKPEESAAEWKKQSR